ncbi:MAG: hypothetical protein LBD76_07895 [Prevotellaceae bacterium]|jgi:hypothetical protein|nr:hypothetical protein [Prevotellaceae bacterium]
MTIETRNYNFKDEELPVICRNAALCLKRDLADFAAFSKVFNDDYVNKFEEKINFVDELVYPKTETNELKEITKRLYETMDSLIDPIAKIRNYLLLAKKTTGGVTAKDIGLAMLSRKISDRDAKGTCQNLLLIIAFLEKYREQLYTVGFSDDIIEQFNDAVSSITEKNRLQSNITGKRKAIVQTNVSVLNNLYTQLMDVLNIGKSLYRGVNSFKFKEYSLSSLKKGIRR